MFLFKTNILLPLNYFFQNLKVFETCAQCILETVIYLNC